MKKQTSGANSSSSLSMTGSVGRMENTSTPLRDSPIFTSITIRPHTYE